MATRERHAVLIYALVFFFLFAVTAYLYLYSVVRSNEQTANASSSNTSSVDLNHLF